MPALHKFNADTFSICKTDGSGGTHFNPSDYSKVEYIKEEDTNLFTVNLYKLNYWGRITLSETFEAVLVFKDASTIDKQFDLLDRNPLQVL